MLGLRTTTIDQASKAVRGPVMKHFDEAALRLMVNARLATTVLAALGVVVTIPQPASAQTAVTLPTPPFELPMLPSPSGNWTVMVGIGGQYMPDFVGSKNGKFMPIPIFSIRRAGSVDQFRGPRDSASIALLDVGNFRTGPAFKYVSSRKSSKYAELTGLGDVKAAYEVGGFVEYYPVDWLRLRSELRQGIGGHTGTVADVSADVIVPLIQRLTISAGPRFTWKSTKATAPYFGIDAAQALASGLPTYDAKGGAHSVGFGSQISYRINPQWEVHAYVEYEKLLGDAADSPLVKQRGSSNQTTVGLGASYSFDFRIR
jgi:outer membrane scaffolding protein for murein synthesis (MipA/OmpV family)